MAVKRPGGLGRGLEALFEDSSIKEEVSVDAEISTKKAYEMSPDGVNYLDINEIRPNVSQPRKNFDESKISDLAESIRIHGMIQPIIVRPMENGFEIVAGERRWRAEPPPAGLPAVHTAGTRLPAVQPGRSRPESMCFFCS